MMPARAPVVVIGGPTASGKSGLALAIAAALHGTVINADSMQLYDGLPILTAHPSAADKTAVPHRLYGILSPDDTCTAARWRNMAIDEIRQAQADHRLPVIAGGTGFYINALLNGLSPIPAVPPHFRDAAIEKQRTLGNPAFHAALAERDPETAKNLDPYNTQRVVRAWEVLDATGRGLAAWQAAPRTAPPDDLAFLTITLIPDRDALYDTCNRRFAHMLQAGAIDETRDFMPRCPDGAALENALGYPELCAYLRGDISLDDASARACQSTRRYAKRQTTWFRNQIDAQLRLTTPDPAPAIDWITQRIAAL